MNIRERVEILAVTVGGGLEVLDRLGVRGHAVLADQCDEVGRDTFTRNPNGRVVHVKSVGRGVGRNRNIALEQATAEFCLLSDDDMAFRPDYEERCVFWFDLLPSADVIVFNLEDSGALRRSVEAPRRIGRWGYFNFGAARVGFRRTSVAAAGIRFSEEFGGGARYSAGEDTLFFRDCLRQGLEIWCVPDALARLADNRPSTWFEAFNAKYFMDKGALYFAISPWAWPFFALAFCSRRRKMFDASMPVSRAVAWTFLGGVTFGIRSVGRWLRTRMGRQGAG